MPELPEVEGVVRDLRPIVEGRRSNLSLYRMSFILRMKQANRRL